EIHAPIVKEERGYVVSRCSNMCTGEKCNMLFAILAPEQIKEVLLEELEKAAIKDRNKRATLRP
ncbi:14462_t:CDS:2, partial [Dentiscutata heterogama]